METKILAGGNKISTGSHEHVGEKEHAMLVGATGKSQGVF